jgi:ribonuclease P protein component
VVGRIGRKKQFDCLRAHGTTVREGRIRLRWCEPPDRSACEVPAVAWAIGRGNGGAVRRNRIRRRLREALRQAERDGRLPGRWYLVTVVPSKDEPGFAQLRTWVDDALARVDTEPCADPGESGGQWMEPGGGS